LVPRRDVRAEFGFRLRLRLGRRIPDDRRLNERRTTIDQRSARDGLEAIAVVGLVARQAVGAAQLDLVDAREWRHEAVGRRATREDVVLADVTVHARTLAANGAGYVELLAKHEAFDLTEQRLVANGPPVLTNPRVSPTSR